MDLCKTGFSQGLGVQVCVLQVSVIPALRTVLRDREDYNPFPLSQESQTLFLQITAIRVKRRWDVPKFLGLKPFSLDMAAGFTLSLLQHLGCG